MAKKKVQASDEQPLKFEVALERLEAIVQQLEDGELGLDEALASYEEGVGHLKRCYEALGRAERKIELLARIDERGHCETTPFEEQEMTLDEKRDARSRRRSSAAAKKTSPKKTSPTQRSPRSDVDDGGSLF